MATAPLAPYQYNATVVRVHDGDSVDMVVDLGMLLFAGSVDHPVQVRIVGMNARELAAPGGKEARDNLAALLPPGTHVVLNTVAPDKYAPRWDARIQTATGDLATALIAGQWAAAWDGNGAKPVPPWPRTV